MTRNSSRMDQWLGEYLSTPLRMRLHPPFPFFISNRTHLQNREDEEEDSLAICYTNSHAVALDREFSTVDEVIAEFLAGKISLRRAEGLKMIYINNSLFVDGEVTVWLYSKLYNCRDSNVISVHLCNRFIVFQKSAVQR